MPKIVHDLAEQRVCPEDREKGCGGGDLGNEQGHLFSDAQKPVPPCRDAFEKGASSHGASFEIETNFLPEPKARALCFND